MASPIRDIQSPARFTPRINEGTNLTARRITALALSAIAAVVSFTILPFEHALVATLGCITLFSLLSLGDDLPRPVRWYGYFNPVRYIPFYTSRPVPVPYHHRHGVAVLPSVYVPARRREQRDPSLRGEFAPFPQPATTRGGIPVLQDGPRAQVGGGHRDTPSAFIQTHHAPSAPPFQQPIPGALPPHLRMSRPEPQAPRASVGRREPGPAPRPASQGTDLRRLLGFDSEPSAPRPEGGAPAGTARVPVGHRDSSFASGPAPQRAPASMSSSFGFNSQAATTHSFGGASTGVSRVPVGRRN